MKKRMILILFFVLFSVGCKKLNRLLSSEQSEYQEGQNIFTTIVDGDEREYYVHVPSIYDPADPTPVVFMLHGTTGFGERFYNISGWKEVGEVENIITVYPSSWKYCITEGGRTKTTTKWNVLRPDFEYCPGEQPRDDIKFLRTIIAELNIKFNVDNKRIYIVGFSNGGQMAGRCAIEMSDVFAAAIEASGVMPADTTFIPVRNIPVTFQLGNSDDAWLGSQTYTFPMVWFDSLLTHETAFRKIMRTHVTTFGLDSTYTLTGDTSSVMIATFRSSPAAPGRVFNLSLIKGLDHKYPNGSNHWLQGAEVHWQWFKQFTLP